MNPVEELLQKSLEIHKKKRADYTSDPDANPYENFTRSNEIASWFPPEYASFGALIGTKLARLGALLSSGRTPNNEPIDDSFLDLVTYCALMYGFYKSERYPKSLAINGDLVTDQHEIRSTMNAMLNPEIRKTKDAPDPTEPCDHLEIMPSGICANCPENLTHHFTSYYWDPVKYRYIKKP